jgi:6-phosphogluconolactonase/glucosamine-6-phosphate isomerase/deaminase
MTYEQFVTLYEDKWQDVDWFFGDFYHIQQQHPDYVDRYIASHMKSNFASKKETAE